MFLIDTNVVSEARRGSPEAVTWLRSADPATLFLSVITLGEIQRGIALKQGRDATQAAALQAWLGRLRHDHADRILPVDDRVALEWGRLVARRPRGDADGLISATAIVHALAIVTRNVADFDDLPIRIVDPWDDGA